MICILQEAFCFAIQRIECELSVAEKLMPIYRTIWMKIIDDRDTSEHQPRQAHVTQVEPIKADAHTQAAEENPGKSNEEFVRLTLPAPSKSSLENSPNRPCVVNFRFREDMNTVLADCNSHEGLLDSIDSNDKGTTWPHNAHNCDQGKPLPAVGRPYKWCQHLGGLDLYLLPTTTEDGGGSYTFSASMFLRCVNRLLTTGF